MHLESVFCAITLAVSLLFMMPIALFADAAKTADPNLQAAVIASQAWLDLLDKGNYGESWDKASDLLKLTIRREEWVTLLEKTRKPLGNATSRQIMDQRTAKNPHRLPKGDYMVMFYKTTFAREPAAYELVTLFLENGQWQVMTYQATAAKETKDK